MGIRTTLRGLKLVELRQACENEIDFTKPYDDKCPNCEHKLYFAKGSDDVVICSFCYKALHLVPLLILGDSISLDVKKKKDELMR